MGEWGSPFGLFSVRLIICPSSFLLPCLFERHRRSHYGGEARLIMPHAIWFYTSFLGLSL